MAARDRCVERLLSEGVPAGTEAQEERPPRSRAFAICTTAVEQRKRNGTADDVIAGHNPEYATKRGDLALIHRRLDSIARYWQPFKVTSVSRDGIVKEVEDHGRSMRVDRFLRVEGDHIQLANGQLFDVDAIIAEWNAGEFQKWDSLEVARVDILKHKLPPLGS